MTQNILVVDDDAAVLELLQDFLAEKGFKVITAINGEDALEKYGEDFNGLVITDLDMPVMNGIELLKRLKKRDPGSIGIILTGHGTMETCTKSLSEGLAYDYLLKPLDNLELLLSACGRAKEKKELELQNLNLIASLKKTNAELLETMDQLRKAQNELVESKRSEAMLEMAVNVAHEVNNPLSVISMNNHLVMMKMDKAHPDYESLQKIKEQTNRITEFVKSIQNIRDHKFKIDPKSGDYRIIDQKS